MNNKIFSHKTLSSKLFSYQTCLPEIILLTRALAGGRGSVLFVRNHGGNGKPTLSLSAIADKVHEVYGDAQFVVIDQVDEDAEAGEKAGFVLQCTAFEGARLLQFEVPRQIKELVQLLNAIDFFAIDTSGLNVRSQHTDELLNKILLHERRSADIAPTKRPEGLSAPRTGTSKSSRVGPDNISSADSISTADNISGAEATLASFSYEYAGPPPDEPIISVCLPVHNAEKTIARVLEGLMGQTLSNIEILIADDQSDDNTVEIVSHYAAHDARIIPWINEECVGAVANYNECLMRARGQFIKLLSQDAWLHPQCLEQMLTVLEQDPSVSLLLSASDEVPLPDWCVIGKNSAKTTLMKTAQEGLIPLNKMCDSPSRVFFRADDIGKGFDVRLHFFAPVDYCLRILAKGDLYVMQSNLVEGASLENDLRRSNGYFVELAMEAICMANNSRELLSQAGFSIEHFIDKVLLGLGGELSNSERIHGPVSLLDPSGFGLSNQDIMLVAVSLLRALGRCNYTGAGAYNDESEIELLEARLRALLESPSWRLTKVLRDLNSGLSRSSQPSVIPSTIAELSPSFSPRAYALLLRTIIRQVKTSRSWRITAPLRSWDGERERWKRTLGKKQNV